MKAIKRLFLGVLISALLIGMGWNLLKRIQEHRVMTMINNGQVIIDQEMHDWGICNDNAPVKIKMYVRNQGQYKITGTLVFSATLSKKGLDGEFLEKFIDCYGEERLKKEMKEEISNKGSLNRLDAVYNYLLRGKQFPQGQNFEPSNSKIDDKDYTFKFRKQIPIYPGEIIKIDHEEQIPLNVRGHLLSIKLESIEF